MSEVKKPQAAPPKRHEQKSTSELPIDVTKTHSVATFEHERPLTCCRIDPTGRFVFAGAEDLNVYRWDLSANGKKKVTLAGHESWVRSLDFSPDGKWLYSGGYDERVGIWRLDDPRPKPIHLLKAHAGWVRWVRVNPKGDLLATCGNDNLVKVWQLSGAGLPKLRHQFEGHQRYPYAVEFHPDGRRLVSFDLMGVVKEWDLETGKGLRTLDAKIMWGFDQKFRADMGGARDMRFSPDGKILAVAGLAKVTNAFAGVHQPMILLFDWEKGKHKQQLQDESFKGLCWGVRFHPRDFIVGVGASQGGKKGAVWFFKRDQKEKKPFHTVTLTHCGRAIDLAPDARRFAVAQFDGRLSVFQMTAKSGG